MAKFTGLVGSGRGKAGNFVFAKGPNGTTIVRAYQPQVTNPNTQLQRQQRAKVALAGAYSSAFSPTFLQGFGGTRRENRSDLLKELIRNSHINTQLGVIISNVNPQQLNLTKSNQALEGVQITIPALEPLAGGSSRQIMVPFSHTIGPVGTLRNCLYNVQTIVTIIPAGQSEDKVKAVLNGNNFVTMTGGDGVTRKIVEGVISEGFNIPVNVSAPGPSGEYHYRVDVFVNVAEPDSRTINTLYAVDSIDSLYWLGSVLDNTSVRITGKYFRTVGATASVGGGVIVP